MANRKDLQKTAAVLTLAAVLAIAVPGRAAASDGEAAPAGAWQWWSEVWDGAADVVAAALDLFRDQGAGLDPNG